MSARGARRAAAAAAVTLLPAVPATGQAPTAALERWNEISAAAFAGGTLRALDTATVDVRAPGARGRPGPVQFRYWATELVEVGLVRGRQRFARGAFTTVLAIRNSIGTQSGARLATGRDGATVTLPGAAGHVPPVVWCCTPDGTEVVVESDGRPAAPRAVAAGLDGTRVRMIMRSADGSWLLVSASPGDLPSPEWVDESRTTAAFPGAPAGRLAVITDGLVAWTDAPATGVLRTGTPSDAGVADVVDRPLGGRILGLWAAPGMLVAATRAGRVVRVVLVDPATGARRPVWRGTRVPRVAVGGGAVAVADGRRILAGRRGAVARVAQARGPVAAVAVDGNRVAWFERVVVSRGGRPPARWTVARLARVRR